MYLVKCLAILMLFISIGYHAQKTHLDDYAEARKAYELLEADDAKALPIVFKLISRAKRESNFLELTRGYKDAKYFSKDITDKLKFADSAISASEKTFNKDLISDAYLGKGIVYYFYYKKYQPALNEYLKANGFAKNSENEYLKNKILYHIAVVKYYLGSYDETITILNGVIKHFQKNLEKKSGANARFNYKKGYLNSLHIIAAAYQNKHDHKVAIQYISKGLHETKFHKEFTLEEAYFKKCKGISCYASSNYRESIISFREALPAIIKANDFAWLSVIYFYMGKNYINLGSAKDAELYFNKVDSIFTAHTFILPEVRANFEVLINISKKSKNTDKQLYYTTQLLKADSIINKDFTYLSTKIHKQYDSQRLLEEKSDLENKNKNQTLISAFLISVSAALIVIFYYRFHKEKLVSQKYKTLLQDLNDEAQNKAKRPHENTIAPKKSTVPENIVNDILQKLQNFENKKMFTQKGLTQMKLATKFSTNTTYLSAVINEYKGANFNNYLGDLRIKYITQKMFDEKKYLNYTTEALAEECGMASRQNFSDLFTELNGLRPKDFIRKRKEELERENSPNSKP